jgi:hypothetical protein
MRWQASILIGSSSQLIDIQTTKVVTFLSPRMPCQWPLRGDGGRGLSCQSIPPTPIAMAVERLKGTVSQDGG